MPRPDGRRDRDYGGENAVTMMADRIFEQVMPLVEQIIEQMSSTERPPAGMAEFTRATAALNGTGVANVGAAKGGTEGCAPSGLSSAVR
jgi:hypothetical protein